MKQYPIVLVFGGLVALGSQHQENLRGAEALGKYLRERPVYPFNYPTRAEEFGEFAENVATMAVNPGWVITSGATGTV